MLRETKSYTRLCVWGLALLLCIGGLAEMRAETSKRKKARYYYTAGSVEKARGDRAAAYEYFKRAYIADPSYSEAAMAYGMSRLEIPLDTLQSETELNRSLAMMRAFVDEYPDDVNEAIYYGYVATQLGNTAEAIRVLERTYAAHPETTQALLQLSDTYAVNEEIAKAVDAIDRYERTEGMNPQVTTRKISYLLADKDTTGAVKAVEKLLATDPNNVSYNILKGNLFDIIEKKDSALHYYRLAEKIDPESGSAKLSLAGYYKQMNDSTAYDSKMYEVLLCEDIELDMKAGILAHYLQELIDGKQDTQRGDHLFEVLKEQYPHEARVLDLAARYSAAKQDFKDAEEQISYAIDQDPMNPTYWGQLMSYQASDNRYDESLATYERAKASVGADESLRMFYAMVAQTAKRYDLAAEAYKEMIHEIQDDLNVDSLLTLKDIRRDISLGELDLLAGLMVSLGDVYQMAGEAEKSYRMYENALTLDPSNAMAANNYAYFLGLNGGDLDKAFELSKKSLTGENASSPTFLDTYAWLLYLKGDYASALETQEKALAENEKQKHQNAELYHHYGDILLKLGRDADALSAWKRAAQLMEENEETDEPEYEIIKEKISSAEK